MKVEQKGHTTIIKDTQANFTQFIVKLIQQHETFKNQNLILDVTHQENIDVDQLKEAKELINMHKKAKKSIVLVAENIDFNAIPKFLIIVPSLLEAHDMIEMDEIERDLGF